MKILVVSLFVSLNLVISSLGLSQTWEKAVGFIYGKEEGAYTICKLSTGDFIVAGSGGDSLPYISKFIKINSQGDVLWKKKLYISGSDNSRIYTSLALDNGCFIFGGECNMSNELSSQSAFIAKLDSSGNMAWSQNYLAKGIYSYFEDILTANDGGFIARSMDYVLKVDSNGTYMWHKPITYYQVFNIISLNIMNNGYIITASNFPSTIRNIIRINNSGEIIWSKNTFNLFYPGNLMILQDRLLMMGASEDSVTHNTYYVFQTYDTSGNYVSTKSLATQRRETWDGFVLPINSNRILFSSLTPLTPAMHYCALRLVDTNMTLIRSLDLTTYAGFRGLYSAVKQDEKYFLAAGNISLHLGYGYEDFYVIKSDTNLNLQVSIGIKRIDTEIPKEINLCQNYPNPFNPFTKIKFSLSADSFVEIGIYDIAGRMVERIAEKKMSAGTYETGWDGSSYPSGIYFCKMKAGEVTRTVKMILVK